MFKKKYYTITEVSKQTGLSPSRLRHLEQKNTLLKTVKIRDRRYYTNVTLSYILDNYAQIASSVVNRNQDIVNQIDILLVKFKNIVLENIEC